MSFNLLDTVKGLISNDLVSKASAYLGEQEGGISKALSGILPSLLAGITDKASTPEGANTVAGLAAETNHAGFPENISSFFDNNDQASNSAGLLSGLFGDKTNLLTNLVASFSGTKTGTAGSLISMAAPLVLGFLGKHAATNNLDAAALASMLNSQKSNIISGIPAGLNLGSIFGGFQPAVPAVHASAPVVSHAVHHESEKESGIVKSWVWPLIGFVVVFALAWMWIFKGCNFSINDGKHEGETVTATEGENKEVKTENTTAEVKGKLDSTGNFIYDNGSLVTIDLPNGAGKLEVGENSTENKLYKFLTDKNQTIDTVKGNWFEFTNVHFKTGGAQIDSASLVELKNIVAITKAFPTATFKIGGYTDNKGDSTFNVNLSQKRADAVLSQLKALGASAASFTGAKGYGPLIPLKSNDTEEGRAMNRRVAVGVKSK
jgi:outer membrane protein OmpA-like peptidoglycan-associated protein